MLAILSELGKVLVELSVVVNLLITAQASTIPSSLPVEVENIAVIQETQPSNEIADLIRQEIPLPEVALLMECESRGRSVIVLDVNNKYSYGPLQFQSSTWNIWSKESGIEGDPMNKNDAIRMANWAIKEGLIHHWRNCAIKQKLLES